MHNPSHGYLLQQQLHDPCARWRSPQKVVVGSSLVVDATAVSGGRSFSTYPALP